MRFGQEHVDPRVIQIDHHYGQYLRSRWMAAYHRLVLRQAVKMAQLKAGMKILDYGCGHQVLRGMLPPGVGYVGYDLAPELSDCTDPSEGAYDLVFAIQVLQYPDRRGLQQLTEVFAGISSRLVVMLPSQNAFKRYVLDVLLDLKKDADGTFRSNAGDVYEELGRKFKSTRIQNLLGVAQISAWNRK